ncbi:hypothetical protein PE067_01160 [Paracoccus sp. DMF-8]|uniref:hypothetical protein n=1 Tax=Paracoccus sp. DMF-8 TaxID=3019445 RepID=UPI0023E773EE|nr:hypothetical protein [Paracoccus sp. DMF-8]MDF3604881.1 hypothetical protein [Paracoccus sp. DMF-8]
MTSHTLAEARRRMALCVPRNDAAGADTRRMEPVSFSLIEFGGEFGGEDLIFRLVDAQGDLLDPALNPVVAGALRDSIALAETLARSDEGQAG